MSHPAMRVFLFVIFGLSGAAGLMYESVWARYLSLFVGHSAYAQVLVLATFLGGMAVGAVLVARYTHRIPDPLRAYAAAEVALGLIGLGFHEVYGAVTGFAHATVFPVLAGTPFLPAAQWFIAAVLILPQSILLGTTFPLMVAGALRRFDLPPGRPVALFYFANSFGAALGVLLAGFWLLRIAGLPGTLVAAAILNLVVGLGVMWAARYGPAAVARPALGDARPPAEPVVGPVALVRLLLIVSFGTATASFMYEIGWLRMLALVLGTATHAFELMLSAFILGLALGALWVSRYADRWTNPVRALGVVQWVMGFAALATLPIYVASFTWTAELLQVFTRTDAGYTGFNLARYGISLAIMLPSTFCAGMTLPLITRVLLQTGTGERAIGAVYGINTLGSIAGVVIGGLVLLPLVGLRPLLVLGAALDMALGVWLLAVARGPARPPRVAWVAGAAAGVVLLGVLVGTRFDPARLASGVYRTGQLYSPGAVRIASYRDGRTASIAIIEDVSTGRLVLTTNGKSDASLETRFLQACSDTTTRLPLVGDITTQLLAPLVTLAHHPNARSAAVIGLGSGISSHALLAGTSLTEVVTAEIEPEVTRAARAFYPANRRMFDDARSAIVSEDARSYLASAGRQFDLIFSEPSNPWVSGVASLFTLEFYEHVAGYLADGGVFGQWIHLYEIDDGLVLSILAGLHAHFSDYEIFMTDSGDMLIVATRSGRLPAPDWSLFATGPVADDLCHAVPLDGETLEALRVTHRAALAPVLDSWGRPNSDYYPVVDLLGERARFQRRSAQGFASLHAARFDPTAPFFGRRRAPGHRTEAALPAVPRVRALALGATLRAADPSRPPEVPAAYRGALYRQLEWRALVDADRPPGDWRSWLGALRAAEQNVAGGTAGWIDEAFYASAARYAERHDAPVAVRQAVRFAAAIGGWRFDQASPLADSLLPSVERGEDWIPVDEFLDGAVVAKLLVGDSRGAARIHQLLAPRRDRSRTDLRSILLGAYVQDAASAAP